MLKADDIEHIPKDPKKLYEMRLVTEVLISKIYSIPSAKGLHNVRTLSDVFQKFKNIFVRSNPKRIKNCVGQTSWSIFIRDVRLLKYKIPLNNTNSAKESTLLSENELINLCQNLFKKSSQTMMMKKK